MKLTSILKGVSYEVISGKAEVEVNNIQYDSRKLKENDLFVCIEGYSTDGHKYIKNAIEKKVSAIICTKVPEEIQECTIIKVEDSRKTLARLAANYYDHPEKKLKLIGITGTNGKTTSTYMMKKILENSGKKLGLIGTIANYIGEEKLESERTTPESLELFELFNKMVERGVEYCVMEVSSHSLYLNRVYGIEFKEGIFTNLTQDHLDFHKTFENYYNAKLILFKNSVNSIINIDDEYGTRVIKDVSGKKFTYAIDKDADLKADNIVLHSRGIEFDMHYLKEKVHVKLNIPGRYNVYNALGSAAACLLEGIGLNEVKEGLEALKAVPGRCEAVETNIKLDFDILIDYAHTPDSLMKILKTAREFTNNKLISVFGCGGDRDGLKRPIMGEVGTSLSDIAVITSDNPRSEEPMKIIDDIIKGTKTDNYIVIENRREAIKKAISIAEKGDVIVIAGKGHEDYQVLKEGKIHFDEREVIAEILKELF